MSISVDEKYKHNSRYCPEAKSERDHTPWQLIMSHKRKIDCRKSCNIVLDVNSRSLKYCFFLSLTYVHFTFMVRNSLEIVPISPLFFFDKAYIWSGEKAFMAYWEINSFLV